jgi:hypothetical protein
MKRQPDFGQPTSDRIPHKAGLTLADAVDHHIITITLECNRRKLPPHPHVERVMHEMLASNGEIAAPYEQCWIMCSVGLLGVVRAGAGIERCA